MEAQANLAVNQLINQPINQAIQLISVWTKAAWAANHLLDEIQDFVYLASLALPWRRGGTVCRDFHLLVGLTHS